MLLRFPPEAVVDSQARCRLPRVLDEDADVRLCQRLCSALLHRAATNARLLQIELHRAGDARPGRAGASGVAAAVGALHVVAPAVRVIDESSHAAEDEPAIREADEGLVRLYRVDLGTDLEQVVAGGVGDVVEQLDARVVVHDGDEERPADAKAVDEIHAGIGKITPTGQRRRIVLTRAVLPRKLEAELVRHAVRELRGELAADGVRKILLDRVGAGSPRVHVERAVHLTAVREIVLERKVVRLVHAIVELQQEHLAIIGAGDRREVVAQGATEGGTQECPQRIQRCAGRPRLLFRLAVDLLVVRREEEQAILHDRSSDGEAELILRKVGIQRDAIALQVARERAVLAVVVHRAAHGVGAALGDHVHESAGRAPELGAGARVGHHQLLHGVEIERERRPLASALLAEERIVEIRTIDADVVVGATLARDADHVAIRSLRAGHVRRQQRQREEIAPVVRQPLHHFFRQWRGEVTARRIHRCTVTVVDTHRRQLHCLSCHAQRDVECLPDAKREVATTHGRKPNGPHGHLIATQWQQRSRIDAAVAGAHGARHVGLLVAQRDQGARHRRVCLVGHATANDAGGRLRLRGHRVRQQQERKEREPRRQVAAQASDEGHGGESGARERRQSAADAAICHKLATSRSIRRQHLCNSCIARRSAGAPRRTMRIF